MHVVLVGWRGEWAVVVFAFLIVSCLVELRGADGFVHYCSVSGKLLNVNAAGVVVEVFGVGC